MENQWGRGRMLTGEQSPVPEVGIDTEVAASMARALKERVGECGCAEPTTAAAERCCCSVDDLVHAIGRKYTMSILNRVGLEGTAHFSELQRTLGVSSSTLAETLEDLVGVGLVRRSVLESTPPGTEYSLTEAGRALRERLRPLLERIRARGS